MHDFHPLPALIGGVMIGLAAALFFLTEGRIAGISSIFGGILRQQSEGRRPRAAFMVGLLAGGAVLRFVDPSMFSAAWPAPLPVVVAAGLLVGFGTQLGSGCTSGHGVCGLGRLSIRSLLATLTFMATGLVTVFVVRHLLGGGE